MLSQVLWNLLPECSFFRWWTLSKLRFEVVVGNGLFLMSLLQYWDDLRCWQLVDKWVRTLMGLYNDRVSIPFCLSLGSMLSFREHDIWMFEIKLPECPSSDAATRSISSFLSGWLQLATSMWQEFFAGYHYISEFGAQSSSPGWAMDGVFLIRMRWYSWWTKKRTAQDFGRHNLSQPRPPRSLKDADMLQENRRRRHPSRARKKWPNQNSLGIILKPNSYLDYSYEHL